MYSDIVFPDGNEAQFIEIASKLGYSHLYFIYAFDKLKKAEFKNPKIKITTGIISNANNFRKAKNLSDFVIISGSIQDRQVLEKIKPVILFDIEKGANKDFIHHRASGLNQVLCKIAHENKVAIGFSFSTILNLESKVFGRISQNIKLCRKYKVKTVIASFAKKPYEMRSTHDLIALFICLGMHPTEAKKSLSIID